MSGEEDSGMYYSDDDCGYDAYYNYNMEDCDIDEHDVKDDPEYFSYDTLRVEEVERLLNESVEALSNKLCITPSLAKVVLHTHEWAVLPSAVAYKNNDWIQNLLNPNNQPKMEPIGQKLRCPVCFSPTIQEKFSCLACSHKFCNECWATHFEVQIMQGVSTGISCMAQECGLLAPEDFVLSLLTKVPLREKYQEFAFRDYVKSKEPKAKRTICEQCKTTFCFKCGTEYHAPTDCPTIKKWLTKCADDSETANYISAHTKDCPRCHICIEKNGGCNHMQCYNCKHDFCWMCLGDWKSHGSEYYECSRYKENPNIVNESVHAQAREALKKYLHYYERWENHSKSLKLEAETLEKIKSRINAKVMNSSGTWIDWQYLVDAASLLAKCRYTLQYTYPYAYYLEPGPRKELFEYQQAQLEAEIENLSWKIERAETTDRGDLENQIDIAEKRRTTLLKDFLHILFCTLNTHKVDMTKLLGGQIGLEDFIFAHRKGRPKEIEITKTEDSLGLTITDNGAGYAFIKRIKEGSIIDKIDYIQVGDHLEKIDNDSVIGRRHFEVAKMLKEIPLGSTFTLRLVEPIRAGFGNIEARGSQKGKKKGYGSGKETLRFKANGQAQIIEEPDKEMDLGIENINRLLENFMGINDNELATQIWEAAEGKLNTMEFAEAVDSSDLAEFSFTDDMIIELWGAVTDARAGRTRHPS
ncbi:hypothetical protein GE061_007652 [Apolygus lucorum]|uniref:RBR-type E3 ubiquitin transferase n=1 Tax=Apolygus lucorum TaxID=248454 RepID=A0A8S9WL28_APOLU|nr:hypothetical protein GE061_007652 [Apolygus lucorum]